MSGNLFDRLTSHQNRCMGLGQALVFVVIGQHAEDCTVVEAESRQHHVGAGKFQNLCVAQTLNHVCYLVADTKTEYGGCLVGSDHLLSQHQITKICITNFSHHVIGIHLTPTSKSIYTRLLFLTGEADSEGVLKGRKLVDVGIFRRFQPKTYIGFCLTKTLQSFLKNQDVFLKPAPTLGLEDDRIFIFKKFPQGNHNEN